MVKLTTTENMWAFKTDQEKSCVRNGRREGELVNANPQHKLPDSAVSFWVKRFALFFFLFCTSQSLTLYLINLSIPSSCMLVELLDLLN